VVPWGAWGFKGTWTQQFKGGEVLSADTFATFEEVGLDLDKEDQSVRQAKGSAKG